MDKPKDKARPFILPPDLADDEDEGSSWIPDEDGCVYLNRAKKPKEEQRGKKDASGRRKK